LKGAPPDTQDESVGAELQTPKAHEILEEILDLSRINQKLLRNPDNLLGANLEEINARLRDIIERYERSYDPIAVRRSRSINPIVLEEFLNYTYNSNNRFIGMQLSLALIRNQFPWIYDVGIETLNIIRSRRSLEEKQMAIEEFDRIIAFSFEHPMMRELYGANKEFKIYCHELPRILSHAMKETISN